MYKAWLALVLTLCICPVSLAADPVKAPEEMDKAINRALEFLSRTQDKDGSWRFFGEKSPGVTGLAVMAFLSAGHVPGEGNYGEIVEKGIRAVLRSQMPNGLIAGAKTYEMYHHGICTLMLAEVAGMTEGKLAEEIRAALEKAVVIILKAQRMNNEHLGGWRYTVDGRDGDLSVTGWQIMALRAAKNLGCDVPPERIDQAMKYVKRCQDTVTGGFRYFPNSYLTVPCTGTAILCLELCGKREHRSPEVLNAAKYMMRNPPRIGDVHFFYGIYYCSQAAFQLGDNYWLTFRTNLHDVLLKNQKSNGSWTSFGRRENADPNYGTAMGVLALTVEYRFLPIYQRGEEPTAGR